MTRDLGLSAVGVGAVFATGGLGSLAGALVTGPATRRFGPEPTMIGAQLVFGLTGLLVPLAVLVPCAAIAMVVAAEFGQWMSQRTGSTPRVQPSGAASQLDLSRPPAGSPSALMPRRATGSQRGSLAFAGRRVYPASRAGHL